MDPAVEKHQPETIVHCSGIFQSPGKSTLYLISGPATLFHSAPRPIFALTRSLPIASRPGRITAAVASPRLIPRRILDIGPRGISCDSSNTVAVWVAAAGGAAKDFAAT